MVSLFRWVLVTSLFSVPLAADLIEDLHPNCDDCLPASVHDAPGIGFDLTPTYGVASIRTLNHTFYDAVVVHGSPEYLSMMERLHDASAPSPSLYEQYLRRLRKAWGKPATADVGVLAEMFRLLKSGVETHPALDGFAIDRVAVVMPRFDAITHEDERDALEFVGLRRWLDNDVLMRLRLSEAVAAFAANGNGLCENFKDWHACNDEADYMPRYNLLTVLFARNFWHVSIEENIYQVFFGMEDRHMTRYDTTYERIGNPYDRQWYWSMVSQQLRSFLQDATGGFRIKINKIQLLGNDSIAADPDFQQMLMDVLWETTDRDDQRLSEEEDGGVRELPIDKMAEPLWAAARGAAIYAQRRQEARQWCREPPECDGNEAEEEMQPAMEL